MEKLATLKPSFKPDGQVTAGNSSQISDGAAAVLLMSAERAKSLGLRPMAKIRAMAVAGVRPEIMGWGPVPSTHKALARAGLSIKDIDLFEINEAFASVVLRFMRDLDLSPDQVNVNGGAIAMGHPLGATGAMILGTLIDELHRTGGRYGLATLCVGGGMGIATVVEAVYS